MIFNKQEYGTLEISKIATWTSNHYHRHLAQALLVAKRKLLKITGNEIYKTAYRHYWSDDYAIEKHLPESEDKKDNNNNDNDEDNDDNDDQENNEIKNLDKLVFYFQTILVNFAYSKNIHKDSVIYDNAGINVTWNDQLRPAQEPTINNLIDSFENDGYEFIDILIDFLNENKSQFPEFQKSIEAKQLKTLFINDATEFNFYFAINESTAYFFAVLDIIRRVQREDIYNALQENWYARIEDFQNKRLIIENNYKSVQSFENLSSLTTPDDQQIILVIEQQYFYKYNNNTQTWEYFAFDCRKILELVKPAIVDLTMFRKFYSDISNIRGESKQLELLRANANMLKSSAEAYIAKIVKFVEISNCDKKNDVSVKDDSDVEEFFATKNSFLI